MTKRRVGRICVITIIAVGCQTPSAQPPATATTLPAIPPDEIPAMARVFVNDCHANAITFLCDWEVARGDVAIDVKAEIAHTISSFPPAKTFNIILCDQQSYRAFPPDGAMVPATEESKARANIFLRDAKIAPTQDPIPAVEFALRQKPDLIFLETWGKPFSDPALIRRMQTLNKVPHARINAFAFTSAGQTDFGYFDTLAQIAHDSGGTFRHITHDDLNAEEINLAGRWSNSRKTSPNDWDSPRHYYISGPSVEGGLGPFNMAFRSAENARRIVFLLNVSSRMKDVTPLLKRQTVDAINQLSPDQSFNLIFATAGQPQIWSKELRDASTENKKAAIQFVNQFQAEAESDPAIAMTSAFSEKPKLIYFLTGGDVSEFNRELPNILEVNKDHRTRINVTLVLDPPGSSPEYANDLQEIANENGGIFTYFYPEEMNDK